MVAIKIKNAKSNDNKSSINKYSLIYLEKIR